MLPHDVTVMHQGARAAHGAHQRALVPAAGGGGAAAASSGVHHHGRSSSSAASGALGSALSAPRAIPGRHGAAAAGSGRAGGRCGAASAAAATAASAATTTPTTAGAPSAPAQDTGVIDLGYQRDIEAKYRFGQELGKGGNGVVKVVTDRESGEMFACKAIRKVLDAAASDKKRAGHLDSIRREVDVLRRLAGSLNIVRLVDVFEDEGSVYLVQELCGGGELVHRIGARHYSERTVASYMRAVLRTLAQCHSHRILHRDVKPGNFMLLDDDDRAPLKAIDFGLAMPYEPEQLPLRDLGLEGTPWYMAPEVLSSQVTPASDVWSAGVMAHQLLTGRLPFDDHRNPFAPSISAVWRSVLGDKVDYGMPWWQGVSDEGKDFVHSLLNRDPEKRPTAKQALQHPWLRGNSSERSVGKAIDVSVVARIQRFGQNNLFKRSVLRMIAEELLARPGALAAESAALHAGEGAAAAAAAATADDDNSAAAAASPACTSPRTGNPIIQDPRAAQLQAIYAALHLGDGGADAVDRDAAAAALSQMGYRLEPSEVARLLEQVDTSHSGKVRRAALAASQIDWRYVQQNRLDDWLDIAARAFAALDRDADGRLSVRDILASLKAKLPADELRQTVRSALAGAGVAAGSDGDGGSMDFEGFLAMLRVGSVDSLDQYDARWGGGDRAGGGGGSAAGSVDRLQALLDASHHGSADGSSHGGGGGRRGLYAAGHLAGAAAEAAAVSGGVASPAKAAAAAAAADAERPSWQRPPVNFRFDFGTDFIGHKLAAAAPAAGAPPETQGAPQPPSPTTVAAAEAAAAAAAGGESPAAAPAAAAAAAPSPASPGGPVTASSYFNNGAVRGGGHFDKRMHGASLYRNAVVVPPAGCGSAARQQLVTPHHQLPTVRE